MDIKHLRSFSQVARSGSLSNAAVRLNVAQPTLSRQIQKLEEELQVQLFVRRPRGIELTQAGSVLLAHVDELIDHLAQTLDLIRGQDNTFSGHVTLGLAPTSGLMIAPEIYRTFKARWPQASLSIREGVSSSLEEWLLTRRVDVAVLHNPLPLEGTEMIPIVQEHMVLITALQSKLRREEIRLRDLERVPLILPSLPHGNRRLLERVAIQHNIKLNVTLEVDSVPLLKMMTMRDFGATIMTYAGVALEVERGELATARIVRPPLVSTICIGMLHDARSSWLTMEFARALRDCIRELVTKHLWAGALMLDVQEF